MKRVVILQSNYIPWKGYFDMMNMADEFILYDEVQYTAQDWRNRNLIKGANGMQWLTIPVMDTGRLHRAISDIRVADRRWGGLHWKSIRACYGKAPAFREFGEAFEKLYAECSFDLLSSVNRYFLEALAGMLGIHTKLTDSRDYPGEGDRCGRLLELCQQAGATHYLSGPAARCYLDEQLFLDGGITVEWMNYDHYPEYPQRFGAFEHAVSVVDLVMNTGKQATSYMKSFGS